MWKMALSLASMFFFNNPNILVVNQGVVTVSGVAAAAGGTTINIATYTPATATAPAQVRVVLANSAGFGLGEFLTINCDIAGGVPTSADFTVPAFSASGGPDPQANLPLTGVTAVVSSFSAIVQ